MAYKSTIVIVRTRARARLKLTTTPPSRLILSLPGRILSLALDKVAYLDRSEAAGAFYRQQVLIVIFNDAQHVEKCNCKYRWKCKWF